MAHLLGSRFCIESLRSDVTDLQGAVIDVFSRVGPVRHPSWKYPDKVSCDLDMTELLELHDYTEDEESNQVAHIVLLELVIDRLVLLLQAMSKHTDQLLCPGRGTSAIQPKSSASIGLVVKKYWSKMVQTATHVQQITTENKNKSRTIQDLEGTMNKLMDIENRSQASTGDVHVSIPLNDIDASRLRGNSAASNCSISRDECIKSTQTVETAFVPCESCDIVQKNLREVGETVINICATQDLPSSLSKHKSQLGRLSWMSGTDVARWAAEQNKDLVRINKHLSQLHSTIEPLKEEVSKEQKQSRQLQARMAECAREVVLERETQSVQQRQYEAKLSDLERGSKEEIGRVQQQNNSLQQGKSQLEKQVQGLKTELSKQHDTVSQLEKARDEIIAEMEEKMTNNEHVHHLEDEIQSKIAELEEVQEKLHKTSRELTREQAKNKSIHKQTESLQGKQGTLVERLDSLDQENEELRGQLGDLEDEKSALEARVTALRQEKRDTEAQLREQKAFVKTLTQERDLVKADCEDLKANIQQMETRLEEALEQQRLIVEYPDLNGPVNPDIIGTGDLATDMENQVRANSVRIALLEEQNMKLRNSITKVLKSNAKTPVQPLSKPVPLWKINERGDTPSDTSSEHDRPMNGQASKVATGHSEPPAPHWESSVPAASRTKSRTSENRQNGDVRESFVVSPGPKSAGKRPQSKGKTSLAKSGKVANTQPNSSSIATYLQLKKSGLLKGSSTPPKATPPTVEGMQYVPEETFSCHKCDKMYNSARDLDLHRSYCYGGT